MAKPEECGNCKKPATIHLTQIINGKVHKVDLCEDCPFKQNVTDPEAFSLAEFLIQPDGVSGGADVPDSCPECGFKPRDFKKTGRFGCPACYEVFHDMIEPMLVNMHKDVSHSGKVPVKAIERVHIHQRLQQLEESLQEAIQSENYEEAARLRDVIRDFREKEPES